MARGATPPHWTGTTKAADLPGMDSPDFDPAQHGWTLRSPSGLPAVVDPLWVKGAEYGFQARADHANGRGVIHGGILATFMDHSLGLMVRQVADGVSFVHSKGIVHRCINDRTAMVGADYSCKLAGFANAVRLDRPDVDSPVVGLDVKWAAPEVLEDNAFSTVGVSPRRALRGSGAAWRT